MNYIPEELIFIFGLIFRIFFYSTFISLMFFERARKIRTKFKKQINIIILFFAICYLGSLILMFFDNKNYGGLPEMFIVVWSLFFLYLFLLNNDKIKLNKKKINIIILFAICYLVLSIISMFFGVNVNFFVLPQKFMVVWCIFFFFVYLINNNKIILKLNKTQPNILVGLSIIFIFFCNSLLNFPTSGVVWISGWIAGIIHGVLSFSLPIFTFLFKNIKPKGNNLGTFIILIAILQFIFGISLSYGIDGYIGDSFSLSIIFIFNTIYFLYIGIYNCIATKKELNIN